MRWWLVGLIAGCGRFGFVEHDAGTDAAPDILCPADFVPVPGNVLLGTADFCVMRTEARAWRDTNGNGTLEVTELDDDGCDTVACDVDWTSPGYLPVSRLPVLAQPWRNVSEGVAQAACRALGPGYDLLANREWMTIARSAELIGANWSAGSPGDGRLVEGNTDGTGSSQITDPGNGYSDTGNDAAQPPDGWAQRRTLVIAGGRELWDVPGGLQEWVDWTLGGALDGPPTGCTTGELPGYGCAGIVDEDFQSSTGTYDSTVGAGQVIGGNGGAARRGGQHGDLALKIAGIYAVNMNRTPVSTFTATGFRCAYRP